jgi:hypothetical protein
MKTLTALAAVAALIAGVSIAGAAGTSATGNGKFCLQTKAGATTCEYASIQACEKIAKPEGGTCISNSSSTTGSGSNSMSKTKK